MRSTESAIISSYPISVSGIIVLLNTKHWIKISRTIFSADSSFRPFCGKIFRDKNVWFPYLDKLQYTRFIPWVESQSDYRKFNIQCLVFNKNYIYSICRQNCFVYWGLNLLSVQLGGVWKLGHVSLSMNNWHISHWQAYWHILFLNTRDCMCSNSNKQAVHIMQQK